MLRTCKILVASLMIVGLAGCGGSGGSGGGNPIVAGSSEAGLVNGTLAEARFSNPVNVAVADDGTVYVADFDNDAIRKISPQGIVSTLTKQENFSRPFGIAISPNGFLFVQTDANDLGERNASTGTVWSVDTETGVATVVARNLGRPRGMVAIADATLALSDLNHSTVYTLNTLSGVASPLAGSPGNPGFQNGTGTDAKFDRPYGIDVMPDGSLIVADQNNNRLRRVTREGVVTTFAGGGEAGMANGPAASAQFNHPIDVAITSGGTVFVDDHDNHMIRKVEGGQVRPFAGSGVAGFAEGLGANAQFFGMEGIDLADHGHSLWVADGNNGDELPYNRVRRLPID